jgi:hypothetical protein
MRPARTVPELLPLGVLMIVFGLLLGLVALWQIRLLKSAPSSSHAPADSRMQR